MDILLVTRVEGAAEKLQASVGDGQTDRYTTVTTWADALSAMEEGQPDLVIIERSAIPKIGPDAGSSLLDAGRWPPLILVDDLLAAAQGGVVLAKRLARSAPALYRIGDLRIDTRKKRAGLAGRWTTLPPLQYRLLLALAQRAGEVVGYRELLQAVWGYDGDAREARELLKVHIRQIRRRLKLDPKVNHYIHSVRGFGYMLAPPGEA